jgi:hypothetical protein
MESLILLLVKPVMEELDAVTARSFAAMVFWMLENNVTTVLSTPTSLVLADQTVHCPDVEMESLIQLSNVIAHHVFAPSVNCCVAMVSWMLVRNVMTEVTTVMLDLMLADPTVPDQDAETVFLTQMNNATMEPPMLLEAMPAVLGASFLDVEMELLTHNIVKHVMMETTLMVMVAQLNAELSVEMEESILERTVIMVLPIPMHQDLAAEPTASILVVVMESLIPTKSATMEQPIPLDQTPAVLIVPNPNVVMVLLIISMTKFVIKVLATHGQLLMVALLLAPLTSVVNQFGSTQPLTQLHSFLPLPEFTPILALSTLLLALKLLTGLSSLHQQLCLLAS